MVNKKEENYKKRIEAIKDVCETWAFSKGKFWFISEWELADNLNNYWYAPLFFTVKESERKNISLEYYTKKDDGSENFTIPTYELYYYLRKLETTIKKIKNSKVIKQKGSYNIWYLIPKNAVPLKMTYSHGLKPMVSRKMRCKL